jgi:tetratricopeptide (TPR) repeat protein
MNRLSRLAASLAHLRAQHWQEAEAEARACLSGSCDDADALLLVAFAVAAGGEPERAAPSLLRLDQVRPDPTHPCVALAGLLAAGRDAEAHATLVTRLYRACLRLSPHDARLRMAFAEWLLDHDSPGGTVTMLRDLSETPESLHLSGMAFGELGAFDSATERFQRLVTLAPEQAAGWSNLGMMLKITGRFDAAIAAHDRAVALAPGVARLRTNRAVTLLQAGRWAEAWPDYETRLRTSGRSALPLSSLLPDLATIADLRGVTILATHEDGFGDTLHFMRYLPLLAERGARVLAWVPDALLRVVARLPGVRALAASGPPPAHDFHCPMFSLPRAFASTPETVPSAPYLTPDPGLVADWAGRLPRHGFRVGIVWTGQARPWVPGFAALDRRRSARLDDFAPLAGVPGVTLVSLQAGATAPGHPRLHDPMPEVRDFADTAAIIANLDLVVSVDTSVVHLAGAMGKPVFLLDRVDNCWRWLHGRADSPWYPSMTIFRQDIPMDWSAPMERVTAALAALVAFNAPPARVAHPSQVPELADAA